MMRRKIAGVIVCMLLISTTVLSVAETMNNIIQTDEFLSLSPYNYRESICGITWDATLSFSETGGNIDSAVFGEAPDACDGATGSGASGNDDYDVQKAPAPMQPYVRAWFDDGLAAPFDCLHGDYRQYPDTSKVWNLSVQWAPTDYHSPTDITISWDIFDMESSEYNAVVLHDVSGGVIVAYMLTDTSYTFTAVAMVPKSFQIICSIGEPPMFSDENPSDGSVDVPVTTSELTVAISNPGGGAFDWSIETIPDIGSSSGVGEFNSTKSCPVSGLSESTVYSWYVKASDIGTGVTMSEVYTFTTPNDPPHTPSNPDPEDGAIDVVSITNLNWTGGDPDLEDTVTYDVYFGTITTPPQVSSNHSDTTYDPGTLDYETQYYWKIVAWDNHGCSAIGTIWDFTTGSEPNDPPYEPSDPNPEDGAMGVSITTNLNWNGGDPDPDDTVTYDVYFGTTSPPPLVISGQSGTIYDPAMYLDYCTMYYWKITAWDNHGVYTEGPIWSFTTNCLPYEPSNPNPEDGETGVDVDAVLVWYGGDPDPGNTVTYDVYFGTTSPPPQVVTGQSETTYDPPGTMNYNTQYYWQIVSWDNHRASASGPEWDFTTEIGPEPDLDCDGELSWIKVKPGSTVIGNFTVENIGDSGSELEWEVIDWPDWGSGNIWTFVPSSGDDLASGDSVTVQVTVVAPDEKNQQFSGQIKIENSENSSDTCTIDVSLATPVSQNSFILQFLERLIHRFPLLERILSYFLG